MRKPPAIGVVPLNPVAPSPTFPGSQGPAATGGAQIRNHTSSRNLRLPRLGNDPLKAFFAEAVMARFLTVPGALKGRSRVTQGSSPALPSRTAPLDAREPPGGGSREPPRAATC
jgi:hypothetical protein